MANSEKDIIQELEARALQLRIDSLRATTVSGSGHPTTCLSAADIISTLFFKQMKFDVCDPLNNNNDRFILSKGHGIPVVYAAYKQLGVLSDEELMALRQFDSPLEGHPTSRFVYNEAATGSLGQGLAIGAGMALQAKLDNLSYTTYILLGDGEIAEGSVWEAAEFAAHHKLGNLVGIVDCNRLGQSGESTSGHDVAQYAKKFEAFGWNTVVVDGHNIQELLVSFEQAKPGEHPVMILAKTYKGYGVDQAQDKNGFHGRPFKKDELDEVLRGLKERFASASIYLEKHENSFGVASRSFETLASASPQDERRDEIRIERFERPHIVINLDKDTNSMLFAKDQKMATRKAFGYALAALGRTSNDVVVLDADVKNSTHTDIFEKEFTERFVQCFIAEQTMLGVTTGLQIRGKIPFAATFGAFLTRAHDQIRMAGVGCNALRLCGSHCGVSIGQDGPSQMGLEDIAMMRAIPGSVVFYPSDAISTYKLVEHMANYNDGLSYIRTTRSATPMLYDMNEKFVVGGCKVLREHDDAVACVVAAGITLHEALKAYEELKTQGVHVNVIDAYCVKPLDVKTICATAKKSGNRIITVEDHYAQGGLGEAVAAAFGSDSITVEIMAVETVSRSGKPEELLAYAGIDAKSVVKKVLG